MHDTRPVSQQIGVLLFIYFIFLSQKFLTGISKSQMLQTEIMENMVFSFLLVENAPTSQRSSVSTSAST